MYGSGCLCICPKQAKELLPHFGPKSGTIEKVPGFNTTTRLPGSQRDILWELGHFKLKVNLAVE